MGSVHEDAGDGSPLAHSLPASAAEQAGNGLSAADSHIPHRNYGPDGVPDFPSPAPAADPVLPPAPAPAPGAASDATGSFSADLVDRERPSSAPAGDEPAGVEQHVRIVLPPPGPDPSARRARRTAVLLAVAVIAGAGADASVAAVGTSRAPQTVVEQGLPDPAGLTGIADPQAILARVLPAVVSIDASATPSGISAADLGQGAGTGMIIKPGGLVLTNDHVVGTARTVDVTLYGQTAALRAKVVAADPAADIALLQIEGGVRPFPTVVLGDSATLQQGDDVLAIGNALALAGGPSVTEGIVSALDRTLRMPAAHGRPSTHLTDLIQTDAPIDPGDSGGPLVNAAGQVVGVDTVVAQSTAGNAPAQDVGLAIAVDGLQPVLTQLERQAHGS